MNARHTDALDRTIGRIVDTMQPEAIYLFGSHARGDADALVDLLPDKHRLKDNSGVSRS
jgi:predicted nucleotidyltransferase